MVIVRHVFVAVPSKPVPVVRMLCTATRSANGKTGLNIKNTAMKSKGRSVVLPVLVRRKIK